MVFFKKLFNAYIWKRIFYEKLSEPLHLNIISFFVLIFGSYRMKCNFDLVLRSQHAYSLFKAADLALKEKKKKVSVIEFGVANGAGLSNLQKIAKKVTNVTGILFDIYGFDTGKGMPKPTSYKDHPECYQEGDFPMDFEQLQKSLDSNTKLIIGNIDETLPKFLNQNFNECPIAFISIDVDYYSSTVQALKVLEIDASQYLPRVIVYLDDLQDEFHNSWCGELAAVNEFSQKHDYRKIERHTFMRSYRIFQKARWIDHIFIAHILDHPTRTTLKTNRPQTILTNPHI